MRSADIKSMKLYHHVDRVLTELRVMGKEKDGPLSVDELTAFDQLHYRGTVAVDHAIRATDISRTSTVLEIGSGLGGPARHIAATAGAHVTALELQDDQNRLASELTARCGLAGRVTHVFGDFLTHEWDIQQFDVIVSWLALYHIPRRDVLLTRCSDLLRNRGFLYAEDLYARQPFTDSEWSELSTELYAHYLPEFDRYREDLESAGFESVSCDDMSDDWAAFARERMAAYRGQKDRHINVHGEDVFASMDSFYDIVVRYFNGGKLGGIRALAQKA